MSSLPRDCITFSNLVFLVVAYRHHPAHSLLPSPYHLDSRPLLLLAVVLSGSLSFLFHATEHGSYKLFGFYAVDHKLPPPSPLIRALLPPPFLAFCEANTATLLLLDELAAIFLMALLVRAIFDKGKDYLPPRDRLLGALLFVPTRYPISTSCSLLCLLVSDLLLTGTPHALAHSLWHVQAFSLLERVLTKIDRPHHPHSPLASLARPRNRSGSGGLDELKLS